MNFGTSSLSQSNSLSLAFSGVAFGGYAQAPAGAWQASQGSSLVQVMGVLQSLIQVCQGLQQGWAGALGGSAGHQQGFAGQNSGSQFAGSGSAAGMNAGAGAFAGYGSGAGAFAGYGSGAGAYAGYGSGAGAYAGYGSGAGASAGYGSGASAGGYAGAFAANLDFGYQQLPGQSQKMWDVWFDSKEGQKTVQRSPLVLDLNKNGQADITGKNITGDGKIDGPTTMFDLDPNSTSYEFKSQQRRPGSGAPATDGGHWVDADGKAAKKGPPSGTQAKFNGYKYLDRNGQVFGEMKDGLYNYGKQEKREVTEWLAKGGGDGFLVADLNGDGEINSAVELFGTEGTDGGKYKNGYEKLSALYDKNHDGQVTGAELQGLQVWADANADGKVQQGELQSLQQHEITNLNVGNYDSATMEGGYTTGGGVAPYFNFNALLSLAAMNQTSFPVSNPYFPQNPQALPAMFGYF